MLSITVTLITPRAERGAHPKAREVKVTERAALRMEINKEDVEVGVPNKVLME